MKGSFRVGEWLIQPELGRIVGRGKSTRTEPKVIQVLQALAESAGDMVPREELIGRVWPGVFVTDDALTRCISVLRRIFEDSRERPQVIETISKRGYRLIPSVVRDEDRRDAHRLLAVLPFAHAEGDGEAERWCGALAEAMIETLTDVPRLRIKAWSTVLRARHGADDPLEAARALGAEAALVGRTLRREERLAIFVELVDVENGWRLWGARYGVNAAENPSPAMENLALQIARNIREKLVPPETRDSNGSPSGSGRLENQAPDESQWREELETSVR
ncbi:MAG: winged helix-turn-helix domain-containing protein [Terriglobia bacterium]